MADYSTCRDPTCGTTVHGRPPICPACSGPMRRLGESKLRASLLIGTGLFLILFTGGIWWTLWDMLLNPGVDFGGSRFTGTAEAAQLIMMLFSALILFGACGLAFGITMLVSGRESGALRKGVIVSLAILIAIGGFIHYALG